MHARSAAEPAAMPGITITGARALLPAGAFEAASVHVSGDRIAAVASDEGRTNGEAMRIDARGLYLLPGIVDLHGDAFEHLLMPRGGVYFPVDTALLEADRQMTANGITTAYHGLTGSWEPGLRSRETVLAVMDGIERLGDRLACDTRVHLRHELHNVAAEAEVLEWIAAGRLDLLALNDHLAMILERLDRVDKVSQYAERSGLAPDDYRALAERTAARGDEVPASVQRLCAAAVAAGLPVASHDDESPEWRRHYRALGAGICEFPCNAETAREAHSRGETVVLGAPNVLRGRSHDGRLSAREAIAAGLCTALTSDYYYPALLAAPFRLAAEGICTLAQAWPMVAGQPAAAAGLHDRGTLAAGQRADLLLVEADAATPPRVLGTLSGGRLQYAAAGLLNDRLRAA